MKGRSLILIFLFLIVYSSVASAATEYNDSFTFSGQSDTVESGGFDIGTTGTIWYTGISFENPENTIAGGVKWYTCSVPYDHVTGIDGVVTPTRWDSVTFLVGATPVGTGQFGYMYNANTGMYYIGAFFDDNFDISGYTGFTHVTISGGMSYRFYPSAGASKTVGINKVELDPNAAMCGYSSGLYGLGHQAGSTHSLYTSYSQQFDYVYGESDYSIYYLNFSHTSGHAASLLVDNGRIVYDDTAPLFTHDLIFDTDLDNTSWDFTVDNTLGDSYNVILSMAEAGPQSAEIIYNQSVFTTPDVVGVIYDIENFDNTNYEYWILLTGTNGGITYFVTNDFYDITTATGQDNFSISYAPLSLPFQMRAELWTYSKLTGVSSPLAYTSWVPYNPTSIAPGTIWTEKSNYNISEMFYIEFDTNYNTVQIELVSATFHDLRTMEGPGAGHLGYMFNTPHNFTAYLIEAGARVGRVDFTVSADEPFLNIYLESVPTKQLFSLEYFTDNTSDSITGFKPDGSVFYGPVTNLVISSKTVISGLSSASPAGIYTISLLHEGTDYFNDTIEMYSTSEYVYFEGNKYDTGDTIKIYSYVIDSRQQIRLSDSSGQAIITWTSANQYIIPNAPTVLYFSLTDNNEYGMNIETAIDTGSIRSGNWKVEIIDIDGKPLTDESTYDYTTVNIRIDEPADASDVFIKLMFSPEGLFMILTVCLTMMGLVTAKHPAGGGAGAVVGVGFGVYFGVLPVWMLLLMVIALVVLAGVSVAVYFKGK